MNTFGFVCTTYYFYSQLTSKRFNYLTCWSVKRFNSSAIHDRQTERKQNSWRLDSVTRYLGGPIKARSGYRSFFKIMYNICRFVLIFLKKINTSAIIFTVLKNVFIVALTTSQYCAYEYQQDIGALLSPFIEWEFLLCQKWLWSNLSYLWDSLRSLGILSHPLYNGILVHS